MRDVDQQARNILTRALVTGAWRECIAQLQSLIPAARLPHDRTDSVLDRAAQSRYSRTEVRQVMAEDIRRGKPRRVLFNTGPVVETVKSRAPARDRVLTPAEALFR